MRTQAETLAYCSAYSGNSNPRAIELAERLAALCYPSINHFFFTSGGGEATESSIKAARAYWKLRGRPEKTKVISRTDAYHGVTLAAMSATGISPYWPLFEPRVPGFVHIPSPYPYRYEAPAGASQGLAAADELEQAILREGPETVAMFIAEPVQGAGGVIVPQDDYFPRIRAICDEYDVLFVADEVITGFGRTGLLFALDHWGVQPDLVQFAKAVHLRGTFPSGASASATRSWKSCRTPAGPGCTRSRTAPTRSAAPSRCGRCRSSRASASPSRRPPRAAISWMPCGPPWPATRTSATSVARG